MGKDQELLEAARNGNVTIVEKILGQRAKRSGPLASLRRGPGANVQDSSGYTALHHAALNGHKKVVKLLLQYEASTNVVDSKGSSPLHLAAWAGDAEIVKLILSQGPSVPNVNLATKDNETALHCAAQYGHTEVVAQLLQHGCDPSIRNSRGESALDLAAQYGRLETVQLLVKTHPELIESLRNSSSSLIFPHTPIHLASRNGHRSVVEVLLAAGVDVNTRTSAGTAMHEAALCGKMEVVRALLDGGVDLAIRDSHDNTVFDLLNQFPSHVTNDITAVIKKHRLSTEGNIDGENLPILMREENISLDSPYDLGRSGDDYSPVEGSSPTQWKFYHKPRDDDRRISGTSIMSFNSVVTSSDSMGHLQKTEDYSDLSSVFDSVFMSMSDTFNSINTLESFDQTPDDKPHDICTNTKPASFHQQHITWGSDGGSYQMPPCSRYAEACSYVSEDSSLTMLPGNRESDQLSISSSSSTGRPSPRDKRCLQNDSGIYLPMAPLSSSLHSPASNNKISPTPPKKPPRRNLSASPTHLHTQMSFSADSSIGSNNYEYLFLAKSGTKSHVDLKQLLSRREQILYATRSVDQYVDMKAVYNKENKCTDSEPIALTAVYGDRLIKLQNPRRKLRRYCEKAYENYKIEKNDGIDESPSSENALSLDQTFVSNAFLTLKSSQESLDDRQSTNDSCQGTSKRLGSSKIFIPTSPTHYVQPPTPDHPPPSALHAEKSIHERIRPLSQVYQRRSRDMETETDEDLLQFQPSGSLHASSASLSSVSLSDKSMSTDNVEEYFGDAPFAGLLKGSTAAERPQTLQRLKNFYSNISHKMGTGADLSGEKLQENVDNKLNNHNKKINIPSRTNSFDEQEEWAKISEIMASFGTGLVRESVFISELENEFQSRLGFGCDSTVNNTVNVGKWLSSLGLAEYKSLFINYGYDDLDFINGILVEEDLKDMGITNDQHIILIMKESLLLNKYIENKHLDINNLKTIEEWLKLIHLDNYLETFNKHLYTDMERIKKIWEVELATVLEIQKPAHRKRILMSVTGLSSSHSLKSVDGSNLEDINKDLNTLKSSIQQLKDEIRDKLPEITKETSNNRSIINNVMSNTLSRHRKNRPAPQPPQRSTSYNGSVSVAKSANQLEIRAPSELFFGVPSMLKTEWRHQPQLLVTGSITYIVNYLGSTVVKELQGTESTKKSIQKLKKTSRDPKIHLAINLSISYRGVRFLDALTNERICDHEIRNIHCACQDADDLTHFAYITKDHMSPTHFCHVFCVPSMDQATEIILTLGEAFEVAYQMVLKDKNYQSAGINNITSCTNEQNNTFASTSTSTSTSTTTTTSIATATSSATSATTTTTTIPISNAIKVQNNNNINNNNNHINNDITDECAKTEKTDKKDANKIDDNNIKENNSNNTLQIKSKTNIIMNSNSSSINISLKTIDYNSHCNLPTESSNSNNTNVSSASDCTFTGNSYKHPKPLVTHGRSHSVNDIKINGNQLKLASTPAPVDDIRIGVKDMKAGSRAPIAFSEEL